MRFRLAITRLYWEAIWPTSVKGSTGTRCFKSPLRSCVCMAESRSVSSVFAPCSDTFSPCCSASMLTRKGMKRFSRKRNVIVSGKINKAQANMPSNCTCNWSKRLKPVSSSCKSPKSATASVPHIPATKCTGTAEMASSSCSRCICFSARNITSAPRLPITAACGVETT